MALFRGMFTTLPLVGVNWTELRLKANERMEVPGGGTNGTAARVKLTVALPPPPPVTRLFCGPLQEARDKATRERTGRNERALLRFIWHPTMDWSAFALPEKENAHRPHC